MRGWASHTGSNVVYARVGVPHRIERGERVVAGRRGVDQLPDPAHHHGPEQRPPRTVISATRDHHDHPRLAKALAS